MSLKSVEVEEQHRQLGFVALRAPESGFEGIEERAPVGEPRQRILARQGRDARIGFVELMREAHVDGQDQHRRAEKQECRRGHRDGEPLLVDLHARRGADGAGREMRGLHADVVHGTNAKAHGERPQQPLPHHVGHGLAAQQEGEREGERR